MERWPLSIRLPSPHIALSALLDGDCCDNPESGRFTFGSSRGQTQNVFVSGSAQAFGREKNRPRAAQAADATYLLAMFGRADYVAEAIEGYRKAVSGREADPVARPFVNRLARLEARSGSPP